MIHLFGISIDAKKRIPDALSSVYGIGDSRIAEVCSYLGVSSKLKLQELTETQISKMCRYIEQHYQIILNVFLTLNHTGAYVTHMVCHYEGNVRTQTLRHKNPFQNEEI